MPPSESLAQGRLPRLADVFYQRIANRRFNSIATFHDPALREQLTPGTFVLVDQFTAVTAQRTVPLGQADEG